jgi:hypothetical protein
MMSDETTPLKSSCSRSNHDHNHGHGSTTTSTNKKVVALDLAPAPDPKADGILNESQNILVLFRLEDFRRRSHVNFWLALACLLCCGINIGLFTLNYTLHHDPNPPLVSERTFHLTEFWTTFLYSLIDAYALVTSPKTLLTICNNTLLLKILFFFNIVAALVPAMLITLDTEYFEEVAHELEYINEFSLSLVSFILLASLLKKPNDSSNNTSPTGTTTSFALVIMSLIVAVITFAVYNFGHEEAAHYFEFGFNISTCLVTFWFCMDNRFLAELEMGQILFGIHRDCGLCKSNAGGMLMLGRAATSVTTIHHWRGPQPAYDDESTTVPSGGVDEPAFLVAYDTTNGSDGGEAKSPV